MTGVLWEKVRTHGHVGEEAEMRVMQPRAKEQARSHQLVRGREGLSLKASEGAQPCQHLSFRIWGFGSLRINFGCVKSLSLCCCCYCCYVASVVSDSVWPHRWYPTGSSVPGSLQARILEWVAISFSSAWKWKVKVRLPSHVWLLTTPRTAAYQALPSMGFPRQEYWSGVPLPSLIKYILDFKDWVWKKRM